MSLSKHVIIVYFIVIYSIEEITQVRTVSYNLETIVLILKDNLEFSDDNYTRYKVNSQLSLQF